MNIRKSFTKFTLLNFKTLLYLISNKKIIPSVGQGKPSEKKGRKAFGSKVY